MHGICWHRTLSACAGTHVLHVHDQLGLDAVFSGHDINHIQQAGRDRGGPFTHHTYFDHPSHPESVRRCTAVWDISRYVPEQRSKVPS